MEQLKTIYTLFAGLRKIPEHKYLNLPKVRKGAGKYGKSEQPNNRRDKAPHRHIK